MSLIILYNTRQNRTNVQSSLRVSVDGDKYTIITKQVNMNNACTSTCSYETLEEVHKHLSIFTHVIAVDRIRYLPHIDVITDVMPMVRIHARLNRKLLHNIVTVVLNQPGKQTRVDPSEEGYQR
jgi:hypothetical protein